MLNQISVTILAKNAQKTLFECLKSVEQFDEVILLDNQSSDETIKIAQEFGNVKIYQSEFIGFGALKNLAISYAKNDWILSLDSDEVLEKELVEEIAQMKLQEGEYYCFLRKNFYQGEWIKGCGWHPDWVKRIFNKKEICFDDALVHEGLKIPKYIQQKRLCGAIKHYSFEDISQLLDKMQRYSSLWAEQNSHRPSSVVGATLRGVWVFIRNYFFKRGVLYGYKGFVISICNALGAFFKYMKLYENSIKNPSVSLIVTTYNQKERLKLVLDSILNQEIMPQEVLIADDGSREDTRNLIKSYQNIFPISLRHIWQEDKGYRLAQSRNRAIWNAKGEYIIIVDGDMILSPSFVADHLGFCKKGSFNQGGRVLLGQSETREILCSGDYIKALDKKTFKGKRNSFLARLIFSLTALRKKAVRQDKFLPVRGCNMAFYKEDALRINGFNQDFIGWGREDSEFVVRFLNAGGVMRKLKFSAIAYHLYHDENTRDMLEENHKIYLESIVKNKTWCKNGLEQTK